MELKKRQRVAAVAGTAMAALLLGAGTGHAADDGSLLSLLDVPSVTVACFPAGQVGQGNTFTGTQNINCSQSASQTNPTPPAPPANNGQCNDVDAYNYGLFTETQGPQKTIKAALNNGTAYVGFRNTTNAAYTWYDLTDPVEHPNYPENACSISVAGLDSEAEFVQENVAIEVQTTTGEIWETRCDVLLNFRADIEGLDCVGGENDEFGPWVQQTTPTVGDPALTTAQRRR
ncbi:hypothetical protein [Streptomyces sp. NBC_00091]|uniref:hypothetical protein n=1 Tax=Streptomyces sp. NBC_00091 TaxID=2975648 RepID=UPI0022521231|nr:hypothetical protein [Streptomyces sp. NBC_00091]MCX5377795.1 hypothetical protein [Streptomyces sp. NBC_00091]